MPLAVGIDVAKQLHWMSVVDMTTGKQLTGHKVANDPTAITAMIDEVEHLAAEHGPVTYGIDVLGGIAGLLTAMLLDTGAAVVHTPGLLVNRSRRATRGGERKSDPADAKVIANQIRLRAGSDDPRDQLRPVEALSEPDAVLRLLVGRRRELVIDQTRRVSKLRDLLTSIHPGLEAVVDPTTKTGMWLLCGPITPAEIRACGEEGLRAHMAQAGGLRRPQVDRLVRAALDSADVQRATVAGENTAARLVRELAEDALRTRERLIELDAEITQAIDDHPDGALIRSLPGMGVALTAEFLAEAGGLHRFPTADALASAAGLAPVLQQSGKMHFLRRSHAGNKALKRVFYQSAFCAIKHDPLSKAFYKRKRAEGKRHHQALIALGRRRVNVIHAMLRTRTEFQPDYRAPAA
ncbi:IS110 family transposase [Pseudonocardia kujensis]|uniref:IS110 family transposase n=1 Tax=Pseudonocardia kujensis TaxID=1128675 RepID=UPI001E62EE49|nr:IS110 family transposase [Pseudonocardia kujensis]MCE0767397.1 IS110 family transposase [Pseudonocardia kujensis]